MATAVNFCCVKSCSKTFGTQRGLTKHQDACIVYHHVTSTEMFEAIQTQESANKRRKIDVGFAEHMFESTPLDPGTVSVNEEAYHQHLSNATQTNAESTGTPPAGSESLGRGKRQKWRTRRYVDPRPEPPAPLPELEAGRAPVCPIAVIPPDQTCKTAPNANGVYRVRITPRVVHQILDLGATSTISRGDSSSTVETEECSWFAPFRNPTTFRLMEWFWRSHTKSIADLQCLADQVLKAEDFSKEELRNFNAKSENRRLDTWVGNSMSSPANTLDGWVKASVQIQLPTRTKYSSHADPSLFTIPGLHYRSVVEVVKAAFQSKDGLRFHYTPFKQYWQRHENEFPQRIYDEMYAGDAWLKAHAQIQNLPRCQGDDFERVIAGLMFWSDSTHLTNFGNASVWPMYLYFGNQSKKERSKPSSHSCYHVAYFPTLPDTVTDAFKKITGGRPPTDETLTHCKRDLMHAVLAVIFDDAFKHATKEGLLIQCIDGITRRVFPRIFTYSADYPEKVLLASIRYLSSHPCPRCLIKKSQAHQLGSVANEFVVAKRPRNDSQAQQLNIKRARSIIYKDGRGVKSTAVEAILAPQSLVPTLNTLSVLMWPLELDFYRVFVVDLLHEIELGLWKSIFVHLIRILMACAQDAVSTLNERYRLVSTFGRDTIRRFTNDASSLKKMAARDYEDLLLCCMPVFEGLFPEVHDSIVQDLLFAMLNWHGLAKLRVHSENTLTMLRIAKRRLGSALHHFQNVTCQAYETRELPSERARRERREARKAANNGPSSQRQQTTLPRMNQQRRERENSTMTDKGKAPSQATRENKRKRFNLNTYKAHAPEHYIEDIQEFGTVDSYSTQTGELEHKTVKSFYSRTNKFHPVEQMTKIERRGHFLRHIAAKEPVTKPPSNCLPAEFPESYEAFGSNEHYHISDSRNDNIYLPSWLRDHVYDPATRSFRRKLKDHLLTRLLKTSHDNHNDNEFSDADRASVFIEYDRLYMHKVLRVHYTTYDGERKRDSINLKNHSDVMLLAQKVHTDLSSNAHPYLYGRVIGIFHAVIRHTGRRSTTEGFPLKMDFLWIRRFAHTKLFSEDQQSRRLNTISFVSESQPDAFGFVDPNDVIRGIHLIPTFHHGKTQDLLPDYSIGRAFNKEDDDWNHYYVNRYVDRDMLMRYLGGGIGHSLLMLDHVAVPEDPTFPPQGQLQFSTDLLHPSHNDDAGAGSQRCILVDEENDEVNSVDEDREEEKDEHCESGSEREDEEGDEEEPEEE